MSQTVFTSIDPNATSGTQLATILTDFKNALMSGLIGNSRPTALQAGGAWIDNSQEASPNFIWTYKVWTGSTDVTVFKVNLATGTASIAGSDTNFTVTRVSADQVAPLVQFIKQRVANNGQLLAGDYVGELQFIGRTDSSGNPVVARMRTVGLDQMTTAANGAAITFEVTATGEAALSEVLRIMNRRVGINTTLPQNTLHVKGQMGIRHERATDDAIGARFVAKKARVSGSGQVQNADVIGTHDFNTTDETAADVLTAQAEVKATETHSSSARGSQLTWRTTKTGTVVLVDHVVMKDGVEVKTPLTINAEVYSQAAIAATASVTALAADKAMAIFTGTIDSTIRGIDATGASKVIVIHNAGSGRIILKSGDTGASAGNRLKLPSARDITIGPDSSIGLFYSATENLWKLRSGSGGGGSDIITTLGDLMVGGVGGYATRLPVGTDGYVLTADSTNTATGLTWKAIPAADLGTATGTLAISKGGTGQTTKTLAANALSPTSAAGDLEVRGATDLERLAVGNQGQFLSVENANSNKLKWVDAPSGGGFNYLSNGDFEAGIDSVSPAKATLSNGLPAGAGPTISAGAAPSIALSVETTNPIRKTKSLKITSSGAWAAGEGVTLGPAFTIQPVDAGKVVTVKLAYQVTSGQANLQYSGKLGTQSLGIAIYDITAGAWVPQPAGAFNFTTQSVTGIVIATFQASTVVGQQYQAFLFNHIASGGAVSMLVDEISIGPATYVNGTPITDWVTFTPTSTWPNNTVQTGRWRRVGDTIEVNHLITCTGAPTSTALGLNVPSFVAIDSNKQAGNARYFAGHGMAFTGSAAVNMQVNGNGSTNQLEVLYQNNTNGAEGAVSFNSPVTWANGHILNFLYRVPVQGWSSAVQMSDSTDTRIVNATYSTLTTATLTAGTPLMFTTALNDTHSAFSAGVFKVPVTGPYQIQLSGMYAASGGSDVSIVVNGSTRLLSVGSINASGRLNTTVTLPLLAGDNLSVVPVTNVTVSASSPAAATNAYLSITRVTGPAAIAASETVALKYFSTLGTSIPANTDTIIPFNVKVYDTHGIFSTNVATIPVSGKYRISSYLVTANVSVATTASVQSFVYKNGVMDSGLAITRGSGTANAHGVSGSTTIDCKSGDTLSIYFRSDPANSLATVGNYNQIVIERVGY